MRLWAPGPDAASWMAAVHAEALDAPWGADAFLDFLVAPGALALAADWDGFILTRQVLDEAEVLTLAVRPDARRRGVGRTLVDGAAERLAGLGVGVLRLEVAQDNPAGLALYAAAGFTPLGLRRGYYARPGGARVDAQMLVRKLPDPTLNSAGA